MADSLSGAPCVCRMHPSQMAQQRASGLTRAQSVGVPHNWGYDDDALLAALVVEYGYNWHFIADTCSSTCVLQVGTQHAFVSSGHKIIGPGNGLDPGSFQAGLPCLKR